MLFTPQYSYAMGKFQWYRFFPNKQIYSHLRQALQLPTEMEPPLFIL